MPVSVDRRIEEPEALPLHSPVLEPSFFTRGSQGALRYGLERVLGQKLRKVDGLALRGKDLQILPGMVLGIGFRDFFPEVVDRQAGLLSLQNTTKILHFVAQAIVHDAAQMVTQDNIHPCSKHALGQRENQHIPKRQPQPDRKLRHVHNAPSARTV